MICTMDLVCVEHSHSDTTAILELIDSVGRHRSTVGRCVHQLHFTVARHHNVRGLVLHVCVGGVNMANRGTCTIINQHQGHIKEFIYNLVKHKTCNTQYHLTEYTSTG